MALEFTIDAREPETRQLAVCLEFDRSEAVRSGADRETSGGTPVGADDLLLFLPTWTPGSYLLREYARHLSRVDAFDANTGQSLPCRKISKNRFCVGSGSAQRVRVQYSVYAHELSVRTADLTGEHAYWNHACVLLWPVGCRNAQARIRIRIPHGWDLACSLSRTESTGAKPPTSDDQGGATAEVTLHARDLDHVIDSPCLAGRFLRFDWSIDNVPHSVILDGLGSIRPPATLVEDLTDIVRAAARVWGGSLPYPRYQFQCLFAAEGHGGLEHGESTTLLMARTALRTEKGYREFLSLAAHELFHAWNVKRLRPVEFWTYDYENENYTSLLWLMEGWTAYYDDLLCLRAGKMSREEYLGVMSRSISAMRSGPGRFRLSLAESSFDAWIRLYRPDENTRNSSQNYYGNGSIAAMCLDLLIRRETAGAHSLDSVLREMYSETFAKGRGYSLDDVHAAIVRTMGAAGVEAMTAWTTTSLDPDLPAMLNAFGIRMAAREANRAHLGITFDVGKTTIASLQADAPAHLGGLAPGDEILALQDLRVDSDRWQDVFQAVANVGEPLEVLVARRGVITRKTVVPAAGPGTAWLEFLPDPTTEQVRLRDSWLASEQKTPPDAAPASTSQPTV